MQRSRLSLFLLVVVLVVLALLAPLARAGGCGYGYSSYSYAPSYSSYSYEYPSYPVPYATVIEKPIYVDRIKYVEKPIYIAQYSPLLVNVPTYSIGYSPCQAQAAAAPAYQQQAQQQAAAAPAPVQAAAVAQPQALQQQQTAVAPCETKLADCQNRLARLEGMIAAYGQRSQTYAPTETPFPAAGGGAATQPVEQHANPTASPLAKGFSTATEVFAAKCAMCHGNDVAAQKGGSLVLLDLVTEGNQKKWAPHQLSKEDWQKVVEQVATGKMPKRPEGVTPEQFQQYGMLTPNDMAVIFSSMRTALRQ